MKNKTYKFRIIPIIIAATMLGQEAALDAARSNDRYGYALRPLSIDESKRPPKLQPLDTPVRMIFYYHGRQNKETPEMLAEYQNRALVRALEELDSVEPNRPVLIWFEHAYPANLPNDAFNIIINTAMGQVTLGRIMMTQKPTRDLMVYLEQYYKSCQQQDLEALTTNTEALLQNTSSWQSLFPWYKNQKGKRQVEIRFEIAPFNSWFAIIESSVLTPLVTNYLIKGDINKAIYTTQQVLAKKDYSGQERDSILAEYITEAVRQRPDALHVVLRGGFHSRDLPSYLTKKKIGNKPIVLGGEELLSDPQSRYMLKAGLLTGSQKRYLILADFIYKEAKKFFENNTVLELDAWLLLERAVNSLSDEQLDQWCEMIGSKQVVDVHERQKATWRWLRAQTNASISETQLAQAQEQAQQRRKILAAI